MPADRKGLIAGLLIALLASLWAGAAYFSLRAQGVTGSDPYAYVQMAVDLAQRGTLLHTFSLAQSVAAWNLPTWPVVPVGYRPPDPQTGQAATVWPPGYAALLAGAYGLGGERWLYLLPPFIGVLALAAQWALSLEVLRGWPGWKRCLAAGVAVLVLATSYRQMEGAVLPMADLPAQLFTVLAIWCALRAARSPKNTGLFLAALAGLCLGAAFAIRYTQVLAAAGLVWIFASARPDNPLRWQEAVTKILAAGLAAGLAALPVFAYHTLAFGNPFKVGSGELALFAWQAIGPSAVAVGKEFLRTNEFFYLAPFLLWGAARLWRSFRREMAALLIWLGVLVLFHLPYAALRARDLLSIFPILALGAGAGVADSVAWGNAPAGRRRALRLGVIGLIVAALLGARMRVTLQLPWQPGRFNTFGYLSAEQRAAFDTLKAETPPDAVVATSLNSGAVSLYAGREIVRPAYWSPDEWRAFVRQALAAGRPVYLLADGEEMAAPQQALYPAYALTLTAELPLPYFYPDGRAEARPVPLYQITESGK